MPSPSDPTSTPLSDSGRQAIAARILALAQAHGLSLGKDRDLAKVLTALHIGDPIPIAAFAVVADVMFAILSGSQHQHNDSETGP